MHSARTTINFLVEDYRLDYIETGSLLGIKYKEVKLYPTGFEEIYRMYRMDIEESLWVNIGFYLTIKYKKSCYEKNINVIDDTMKRLFMSYIVVEGVPKVGQSYMQTHDKGGVI